MYISAGWTVTMALGADYRCLHLFTFLEDVLV